MKELLELAVNGAAAGAKALRADFMHDAGIVHTDRRDIKTVADTEAQKQILEVLQASGIPIFAEEGLHDADVSKGRVWLVDPLDGTYNFSRRFPIAAVSVGLWEDGQPLLGVVHDVFNDEVYSASNDGGAWLGGKRISVSSVSRKEDAVIGTGFPAGRNFSTESLMEFIESVQQFKKIRLLGSAAMMLAHVAAGRFDVYEEEDIYLWDVAGGLALVQAAGGKIEVETGTGPLKYHVRASNGLL